MSKDLQIIRQFCKTTDTKDLTKLSDLAKKIMIELSSKIITKEIKGDEKTAQIAYIKLSKYWKDELDEIPLESFINILNKYGEYLPPEEDDERYRDNNIDLDFESNEIVYNFIATYTEKKVKYTLFPMANFSFSKGLAFEENIEDFDKKHILYNYEKALEKLLNLAKIMEIDVDVNQLEIKRDVYNSVFENDWSLYLYKIAMRKKKQNPKKFIEDIISKNREDLSKADTTEEVTKLLLSFL